MPGSRLRLLIASDGSALILSIAKYYTANGKVIQDTGITPNVLVAATDDLAVITDDDDNNTPDEPQKPQQKEDEQLRRAIEVLKTKAQKS